MAQLMADLQKMPGGAGILQKHANAKKKAKDRGPRPPRSADGGQPREPRARRNPERGSRRQTRSMGGCEDPSGPPDAELELSLEDELLEVRHQPRRGTPRPSQTKPHVVRPVDDITEEELQLVADSMTEKVYNRSTEWQCPPCRGICNCSFCRAREGRCPTGILFPLAQYHGFSDVHSYLSSLRNKLKSGEEDEDL
ncbi:hypothetical protein CRUP_033383 [Coryphaenoides rupestris]|nr:hypothetical protein CRUP_033383 [Coryphaenoides rupestris]